MKLMYGVESDFIINDLPELKKILFELPYFFEHSSNYFIFHSEIGAKDAKNLLQEVGIFIETHVFIYLQTGTEGECYFDYNLSSEHNHYYLFKELVISFHIERGTDQAIEMFKYQLDEHLVFKAFADFKEVFFVDHTLEPLIVKTAQAYDIEVSFFNLDK